MKRTVKPGKPQKNFTLTDEQKRAWDLVRRKFPVTWTDGEVLAHICTFFVAAGTVPLTGSIKRK